jgi:hypothetical protein
MKFKPALALSLLATAACFDACATDLVPLEWSADGSFAREMTLPAGKFVEACGKLPAKAQVKWKFQAGAPMDFNIHFHEGKQVHYPAKTAGATTANGTLDVQSEQDYCWMWTNKSSGEASLKIELERR